MIRLAIVGLGAVTRNIHLPAYKKLSAKISLVGGCDVQEDARAGFAKVRPLVPVFSDIDQMLRTTKPDIVSICTPPFLHFSQCLAALKNGCHVFCEKPMVETLAEADDIISAAEKARRRVVVNSQFPFMKIHAAAKAHLGRPDFGRLLFLHASQTFRPTPATEAAWRGEMARRLGFEFGVHAFELVRFFFEEDPVRIIGHMPNPTDQKSDVLNIITVEFPGGRTASILLDRLCKGPERYLDLRLDGEFATITTSIGGELAIEAGLRTRDRKPYFAFHFAKGGKAVWQNGDRSRILAKEGINPFARATAVHLDDFIDALGQNKTPAGGARDHRKTLAMIFAAYDSAAAGCSIELAPYLGSSAVPTVAHS
jgi:predicted dehydrogenase